MIISYPRMWGQFSLLLLPCTQGLFFYLCCRTVVSRPQLWSSSHCVRDHRNGLYVTVLATMTAQFSRGGQKGVAKVTETCWDLCKVTQWAAGRSSHRTIVSKSQLHCKTTDRCFFLKEDSHHKKRMLFLKIFRNGRQKRNWEILDGSFEETLGIIRYIALKKVWNKSWTTFSDILLATSKFGGSFLLFPYI